MFVCWSGLILSLKDVHFFNHFKWFVLVTYLQVMGKQKLTIKTEEESNPREKYITWTDEATRFMLDWYIELRKDKPATFKFKKQHHLHCADALNGKFTLGVTQTQVDRHYRSCKEKWGWVRRAMANSGNGFDRINFTFTLSESEKQNLSVSLYYCVLLLLS